MIRKILSDFFLGILISFTVSVLFITIVYTFSEGSGSIPVLLVWQSLVKMNDKLREYKQKQLL
ncbi:MAG: hypothetical protein K0Q99_854 [Clostridia bacterium]|nr:hypothetical protein [Clostridia bacterium]